MALSRQRKLKTSDSNCIGRKVGPTSGRNHGPCSTQRPPPGASLGQRRLVPLGAARSGREPSVPSPEPLVENLSTLTGVRTNDAGPWQLPIVGFEIGDVWFSWGLYLIGYGEPMPGERMASRTQVRFGGALVHRTAGGQDVQIDAAGPWHSATSLLDLRHARITAATATATLDGRLRLSCSDGSRLEADPDSRYENWEISGPGKLNLVCPPGGGDPRISS